MWAREVVQWLRTLAALIKDMGFVSSANICQFTTACNSNSSASSALFGPL